MYVNKSGHRFIRVRVQNDMTRVCLRNVVPIFAKFTTNNGEFRIVYVPTQPSCVCSHGDEHVCTCQHASAFTHLRHTHKAVKGVVQVVVPPHVMATTGRDWPRQAAGWWFASAARLALTRYAAFPAPQAAPGPVRFAYAGTCRRHLLRRVLALPPLPALPPSASVSRPESGRLL